MSTYRTATETSTIPRPPADPIAWNVVLRNDAPVLTGELPQVYAQTWFSARQQAHALLGAAVPAIEDLIVTPKVAAS